MNVILIYFSTINLIGFFTIWNDKNRAVRNQYRIPEKVLLAIVTFGGMIGSGLAMVFFRHKISKYSYLWKFFVIIIIQISLYFAFFEY